MNKIASITTVLALAMTLSAAPASAQSKKKKKSKSSSSQSYSAPEPTYSAPAASASSASTPENTDVGSIKQKYWTRGDNSEIGVVQNRIYSKAGYLEAGIFGGWILTDPFLSVHSLGGRLGYHFNEFWSVHAIGWKDFSSHSSAYTDIESQRGAVPVVNNPNWFAGGELQASLMYGKLSFLGKSVIYYDFHILGGGGTTNTENGNYLTPYAGIGQQIYLSKSVALTVDYRLMAYYEDLKETAPPPAATGQYLYSRWNWTNSITLGVSVLIGNSGD